MGEVEGTKPAQTILDRGVFLRWRAEAPYFIVLFIYFISFQVVRKPYVLLYRQEGDPVSELFQKYNLSDLKLKTLVPLSYP